MNKHIICLLLWLFLILPTIALAEEGTPPIRPTLSIEEQAKLLDTQLEQNPDTKTLDELESFWKQQIRKNPQSVLGHVSLGRIWHKKGKYKEALQQYNAAEYFSNQNPSTSLKLKKYIRIYLGILHLDTGRPELAIQAFNSILKIDPKNADALRYKAFIQEEIHNKNSHKPLISSKLSDIQNLKEPSLQKAEDAERSYLKYMEKEVARHWKPPSSYTNHTARVQFDITKDGQILNPVISKTSGNEKFDRACLKTLNKVSLQPFPKESHSKTIRTEFTFDYAVYPSPATQSPVK